MNRLVAFLLLLLASQAQAQSPVRQSGTVTPRHAACWTTTGVIQDCGTAASPFLTSIGTLGQGPTICASSAATTGAYNQLCLGANTSSAAQITLQNFGGASAQNLEFVINGSTFTLPTSSSPLPITQGGTGASTAAGARTNLGLGTMAVQNANAVAITGGSVTGMPTPTANSDVATKEYVDATATGLTVLPVSKYATAAVLPNTPSYNNGTAGVGATLTASANAALVVDGATVSASDVVLVKNQASAAQNGIYTVTTVGDGSNAWVLTRATYFDTSAEMVAGSLTNITAGASNAGNSYVLQTTVATVGSSAVTFNQFSSPGIRIVNDFYLDSATGNDSNDCLSATGSGPCLTFARVISAMAHYASATTNGANYQTIHVAGTITGGAFISGPPIGLGYGFQSGVIIDGGGTATIDDTTSNCGTVIASNGANVLVQNITITKSTGCAGGGAALYAQLNSTIRINTGVTLGATTGPKIYSELNGAFEISSLHLTGNSTATAFAANNGMIIFDSGITITCDTSFTVSGAFYQATAQGIVEIANVTYSGCSGISGRKYTAVYGGLVYVFDGVTSIPGDTVGYYYGGGQIVPPPVPTLTSCTNGVIGTGSTDDQIHLGFAGNSSTCTITFANAKAIAAPICVASNSFDGVVTIGSTTSQVTVAGTFVNGETVYILCSPATQ